MVILSRDVDRPIQHDNIISDPITKLGRTSKEVDRSTVYFDSPSWNFCALTVSYSAGEGKICRAVNSIKFLRVVQSPASVKRISVDFGSIVVEAKKYNIAFLQLRYLNQYKAHAKMVYYKFLEHKFL